MSQYVKDEGKPTGWKVISYGDKGKKKDKGAPVTADGMDELADDGSDGEEPESSQQI